MKVTKGLVTLTLTFQLSFLVIHIEGLKCYVCNDCEVYYNETQLTECDQDDKCIKTVESGSGLVSRDCGEINICIRAVSSTKKSSRNSYPGGSNRKSEKSLNNSKRKRSPPLLALQTTTTPRPPPPSLIASLHCCDDDDGCNGVTLNIPPSTLAIILTPILILLPLLTPFLQVTLTH